MKRLSLIILVLMVVLTACQSGPSMMTGQPTQAPSQSVSVKDITQAEDIYGVWKLTHHPHYDPAYWLLRPNGTYTFSPNQDGGRPGESGTYWFENGQLLIKDDFCPTPGKYTVQEQEREGGPALVVELVEDGCTARMKILTGGVVSWIGSMK